MTETATSHRADPMEGVPPFEHEQRSWRHRQCHAPRSAAGKDGGDIVIAFVVLGPNSRMDLEVAARIRCLDGNRHDEVGLVEMPLELLALAHHSQVEGTERIGVAMEWSAIHHCLNQVTEGLPLVELAQWTGSWDCVVGNCAHGIPRPRLTRVF